MLQYIMRVHMHLYPPRQILGKIMSVYLSQTLRGGRLRKDYNADSLFTRSTAQTFAPAVLTFSYEIYLHVLLVL